LARQVGWDSQQSDFNYAGGQVIGLAAIILIPMGGEYAKTVSATAGLRSVAGLLDDVIGGTNNGAGSSTKLYRVMDQSEYETMINNGGKFAQPPAGPFMEEKWFATTQQDAAQWGSRFYPDSSYRMIEIELPSNSLNQMYYNSNLDGIGPAYSGKIDWLNSFIKGVKTIK
jgi:hypothetical protein